MFAVSARRLTQAGKDSIVASVASKPALTVFDNPYTARKAWPPAVDHLNPAQQLRFEKKYKRRVYLACHSPKWQKATKIGQLVSITGSSPAKRLQSLGLLLRKQHIAGLC